jgi:hypothetical protein
MQVNESFLDDFQRAVLLLASIHMQSEKQYCFIGLINQA